MPVTSRTTCPRQTDERKPPKSAQNQDAEYVGRGSKQQQSRYLSTQSNASKANMAPTTGLATKTGPSAG